MILHLPALHTPVHIITSSNTVSHPLSKHLWASQFTPQQQPAASPHLGLLCVSSLCFTKHLSASLSSCQTSVFISNFPNITANITTVIQTPAYHHFLSNTPHHHSPSLQTPVCNNHHFPSNTPVLHHSHLPRHMCTILITSFQIHLSASPPSPQTAGYVWSLGTTHLSSLPRLVGTPGPHQEHGKYPYKIMRALTAGR